MSNLVALGVGFFILPLIVGGGLLFNGMRNDRRLAMRFANLHRTELDTPLIHATSVGNVRGVAVRFVSGLGEWVLRLGLLSGRTRNDTEAMLRGAGHTRPASLRVFIGSKILLLLILPVATWLATSQLDLGFSTQMICIAASAIGGMLAPDTMVQRMRERHKKKVQEELPDALDMMVICAQAGLGLGTSIVRVAQELQVTHRAIAMELAHTANEMQMMTDAKLPLINLGDRCGVESAKRLAATLLQSVQYGTPLTEALRGLAGELRTEMIVRFEARAARMPVLLTLPMVAFILPSVFLVIGGPAVIQVINALS